MDGWSSQDWDSILLSADKSDLADSVGSQNADRILELVTPLVEQVVHQQLKAQQKVHGHNTHGCDHEGRFSDLEQRLNDLEASFGDLVAHVNHVEDRQQRSERSIAACKTTVEKDRLDLQALQEEVEQSQSQLCDLESRLSSLETSVSDIEAKLGGLEENQSSLYQSFSSSHSKPERHSHSQLADHLASSYTEEQSSYSRPNSASSISSSASYDRSYRPQASSLYERYSDELFSSSVRSSPRVQPVAPLFTAPPARVSSPTFTSARSPPVITKKHKDIVSDPRGSKPVTSLPGIGPAYGKKLCAAGYSTANDVLRKFRALGGDEVRFKSWLKATCGANSRYQDLCYQCLCDWNSQY
ncbi:hypothetical protein BaRGS_00006028 [Batillaria attramentaria]|uniref:Uncharacterized protein n=1 Tax=Batillaria attramentaria TaxID=370345 RepID=A0ABD0LTS4_9CAEN